MESDANIHQMLAPRSKRRGERLRPRRSHRCGRRANRLSRSTLRIALKLRVRHIPSQWNPSEALRCNQSEVEAPVFAAVGVFADDGAKPLVAIESGVSWLSRLFTWRI